MGIDQVRRGIILDRDGTLIDVVRDEETGVITTAFHPSQLRLLGGVVEGLGRLQSAGFALAIATNQPGPAKGHFSRAAVEATNAALVAELGRRGVTIEKVVTCMHHPLGGEGGDPELVGPCDCRKPRPGMLIEILTSLGLEPSASWIIGDTTSDLEAGRAARVSTALVFDTKRCELCPLRSGAPGAPDVHGASFLEVAESICAKAPAAK